MYSSMAYGTDLEAFSWCLEPGNNYELEFFPIVRNAGVNTFSRKGWARLRLVVINTWYGSGPFFDAQRVVNLPISIENLDFLEILKLPEGLRFDYVFPGKEPKDATTILFDYRLFFDDDENTGNNYHRALLGDYSHGLANKAELICHNTIGEIQPKIASYGAPDGGTPMVVRGMCLGLWHNAFCGDPFYSKGVSLPTVNTSYNFMPLFSRDAGSSYEWNWWMARDVQEHYLDPKNAPPGLVLALRHSIFQSDVTNDTAFDLNPVCHEPGEQLGLIRRHGGDHNGGSGTGFYWYEIADNGFSAWSHAETCLPKGTMLGLTHTANLPWDAVQVPWNGRVYNPRATLADPVNNPPPPGFKLRGPWDIKAADHNGFLWYEKLNTPTGSSVTLPIEWLGTPWCYNEIYGTLTDELDKTGLKVGVADQAPSWLPMPEY